MPKSYCAILLSLALVLAASAQAPAGGNGDGGPDDRQVEAAIKGGLAWLEKNQVKQGDRAGSWDCVRYRSAVASLAEIGRAHV